MARGLSSWIAGVVAAIGSTAGAGCSFVLDWDVKPDAGLDPVACAFKEPNDSFAAAQLLTPGETGPAAICVGGDLDFYRFNVPADPLTVTISVTFDSAQDLDLNLYDSVGTLVSSGVTFGLPEERITCPGPSPSCPQLTTGDYVFEVLGGSAVVKNLYSISLTVQ